MKNKTLDQDTIIIISIFEKNELSLLELEEIVQNYFNQFGIISNELHLPIKHPKYQFKFSIEDRCKKLIEKNFLIINKNNKYELTQVGKNFAQRNIKNLNNLSKWLKNKFLNPIAAAKNTVIIDLFLAIIKLFTGFLSGSIGLIADGSDAALDAVSASVVWVSIKFKRELIATVLIVSMMFVTGAGIGFDSLMKIYEATVGNIIPIEFPYLVIIIEAISMIIAILLSYYQGFVGKKFKNLAIISQSIDSRNHVYTAAVVIIGGIFSIFGIHFIDVLIGGFVALRILIDGVDLSKETFSTYKGKDLELSKYKTTFEERWDEHKYQSFRIWILLSLKDEKLKTSQELIQSLSKIFRPKYVPLLSIFNYSLGKGVDFNKDFENLISPLIEKNFINKEQNKYLITKNGKKYLQYIIKKNSK